MKEYFLIVYTESSDEIHFRLMNMLFYDKVMESLKKFSNKDSSGVDEFLEFCHKNETLSFYTQEYCTDPWVFNEYKIVKIVSIPEFGF